jgi:hypothetical protein
VDFFLSAMMIVREVPIAGIGLYDDPTEEIALNLSRPAVWRFERGLGELGGGALTAQPDFWRMWATRNHHNSKKSTPPTIISMLLPESKIKQSILHPREDIRLAAVSYFCQSRSQDEGVMPLVIEAVEKHGREMAFRILRDADDLAQTPATVGWLVDELRRQCNLEDVDQDNYRTAIALILYRTSPALLSADMATLPNFPEELVHPFLERLEMTAWDWETGWVALEALGKETEDLGAFQIRHVRRGNRIADALAKHQDHAESVLALVNRRYRGKDRNLMQWLEPLIIELAGAMRLEAAILPLVDMMHEDYWATSDSAILALKRIGGDKVVQAIADQWPDSFNDFRQGAAEVLGHIHTELSAAKCLAFLAVEESPDVQEFLADAALNHFASEAIEPARQMTLGDWDDLTPDESDLRYHLVTAATIMESRFPEYDDWYAHAVETNWGWGDHVRDKPIRENLREDEVESDEEEYLDEDESFVPRFADSPDDGASAPPPFRYEEPRVGRNEPCLFGSGKKYKKCCLLKAPWIGNVPADRYSKSTSSSPGSQSGHEGCDRCRWAVGSGIEEGSHHGK